MTEERRPPPCFGLLWEAIEGSECFDCMVFKQDCLARFATSHLPKVVQKLGADATLEVIAEKTGVKIEALRLAFEYQRQVGLKRASAVEEEKGENESMPAKKAKAPPAKAKGAVQKVSPAESKAKRKRGRPPKVASEPVAEQPKKKRGRPPKAKVETPTPPKQKRPIVTKVEVEKPKKKRGRPPKAEVEQPKKRGRPPKAKEVEQSKKPKKKRGRPPKVKATVEQLPSTKSEEPVNPSMAKPVEPATDLAKQQAAKRAPNASEPAGKLKWKWGEKRDLARWERERKKNPKIGKLLPGMTLEKEFPKKSGDVHQVQVRKHYYLYRGERYPTLSVIVTLITGTVAYQKAKTKTGEIPEGVRLLSPWSAARFFNGAINKVLGLSTKKKTSKKTSRKKKGKRGRPRLTTKERLKRQKLRNKARREQRKKEKAETIKVKSGRKFRKVPPKKRLGSTTLPVESKPQLIGSDPR